MSTENKAITTPVVKKEEFTYPATEKGSLVISVGLQRRIEWLHKMVGAKEWCGVLFYKRLDGDIDNPRSLKLYAQDLYLMDIGKETYTEADFSPDTAIEMWDTVADTNGEVDYGAWKRGLIHTHHNMTTFFSGTDMSELHDNVGTHNYYLSLIVNFSGVWTAKVAFTAKRKIQMNYTSVEDEAKEFVTEKDLLMMIDMDIVKEREEVAVPEFFRTRYEALKAEIEERTRTSASKYSTTPRAYQGAGSAAMFEDEDEWAGYGCPVPSATPAHGGSTAVAKVANSPTLTSQGNLEKDGKTLKPLGKVQAAIGDSLLAWLNAATSICSDMEQDRKFTDVGAALEYFRDYFDEPSHDLAQYKWFIDQIQRDMESKFKKWWPALVQRVGMETFDIPMLNNPVAADLYDMFEAYPQFMIEMGHINRNADKEASKNKGSNNKKQRQHVNARRRH